MAPRHLPDAPKELPEEMAKMIKHLDMLWASSPKRPRPDNAVLLHWDGLVSEWYGDNSLPLYVRKGSAGRGLAIALPSGREIVPTDNSPAQWAFAKAALGEKPSIDDVRRWIVKDRIPVAMVMKAAEKSKATYKCCLNGAANLNIRGWKLAHIEPVGLGSRGALTDADESELHDHFLNLMAPRNMFVIPKEYAGLGELREFRDAIKAA